MAPPKKPGAATPSQRQAASLEALRRSGGDKVHVKLNPVANAALRDYKAASGLNTTEVVNAALIQFWQAADVAK
jgi:hypothetical protein